MEGESQEQLNKRRIRGAQCQFSWFFVDFCPSFCDFLFVHTFQCMSHEALEGHGSFSRNFLHSPREQRRITAGRAAKTPGMPWWIMENSPFPQVEGPDSKMSCPHSSCLIVIHDLRSCLSAMSMNFCGPFLGMSQFLVDKSQMFGSSSNDGQGGSGPHFGGTGSRCDHPHP